MDETTYPKVVTLQPVDPDGKFVNIEVPGKLIADASSLIKDVLADGGEDNEPIPLLEVKVDQLNFIVAFYTRYFAEKFVVPDNKGNDMDQWFVSKQGNLVKNGFPAWAEEMLDTIPLTDEPIPNHGRFKNMFDIAEACNYMDCSELRHFIMLKFSSMITGKSTEEIRAILAIENDFDDVDEYHMKHEVIVVTNPDGTTREIVKEYKVWDKITEETAKVINRIPV